MRLVNQNPKDIKEAERAMSNAYYNYCESSGNSEKTFTLHKIWDKTCHNYRKFK